MSSFYLGAHFFGIAINLINRARKPWTKYNLSKLHDIIKFFALLPDKIILHVGDKEGAENNTSLTDPAAGWYLPDSENDRSGIIFIDTRFVRSEKEIVSTLLHEICHHNQTMQGRMRFGKIGLYNKRPIEVEAFAYSKAWKKIGLYIYRRKDK